MDLHQKKFVNSTPESENSDMKHAIDVDIIESNEGLILYFDLPGFLISDIKMLVSNDGILKISPFYYWSDEELDDYLKKNNLPKNPDYFDPVKALQSRECGIHNIG